MRIPHIPRHPGLKTLAGFRLKGPIIYSPRGLIRNSGTQEECKNAQFPQTISCLPDFLIQKKQKSVISQHSLKPVLRHESARSGSALVITLGLLAVLGLLVFGYVYSARTERFAARHARDRATARQFVDLALNAALEDIKHWTKPQGTPGRFDYVQFSSEGIIYESPLLNSGFYQPFSPNVCMSIDTNGDAIIDVGMLTMATTKWIPRVLFEEAQRNEMRPYWLPIEGVNETTGESSGTNGFISFAVFNCSGLLDANFATSTQLVWLASQEEDPDITDLDLFLQDRARATATNGLVTQYLDLHDLRLRSRGLAKQPRNLFTWSYDPGPDVTVINGEVYSNRDVQLVPKFNVNSWTNGLDIVWDGQSAVSDPSDASDLSNELTTHYKSSKFLLDWLSEVTNRFAAVGLANPQALAWNLVNFMDPDRIPQGPEGHIAWQEPWPVEDVPLINEVAVGMVPLDMADGPNHYAPGVELWYPFATNRITKADEAQLVVAVYTNWVPDEMEFSADDDAWIDEVIYPQTNQPYGFYFTNTISEMAYGTINEFVTATMPPPYISFPVTVTNAVTTPLDDDTRYMPKSGTDTSSLVAAPDGVEPPAIYLAPTNLFLPLGIASYSTYLPEPPEAPTVWVRTTFTVTNTIHLLARVKLGEHWVDEAAGYHPGDHERAARTKLLDFTEPCGYEVNDPRRNGYRKDWRRYLPAHRAAPAWEPGKARPVCSLNGTTNLIANPWHKPYGQGLPLMHFNRLLDRAGDIGHIQQPERYQNPPDNTRTLTNHWQSICLADPTALATNRAGFAFAAGSILEFFTTRASCKTPRGMGVPPMKHGQDVRATYARNGFARASTRATNTPIRGLVHFSTTHTNVVEAIAADLPVSGISNRVAYLPKEGVKWFTRAFFEAQSNLYSATPIGVGDLGFGFGASPTFLAAPDIAGVDDGHWHESRGNDRKEDLIRGLAERVSFRQHVFVICLAGKTVAPSGRTTAIQRAVAIVLRDAYTGRWQVVSWQWL